MVTADLPSLATLAPFSNTPFTDFSTPENVRAQREALRQVEAEFGQTYPLIIGAERRSKADTFTTFNPAQPEQALAHFAKADVKDAHDAIQAAWERFRTW
ncbi:MAG TPA: hypothetical protein VKC57_09685, partial [Ktedonobacterales bacterium]|nr:hypothetical protein [Ktedonobacterales bacterium]